jgi:hypothetical protein
MVSPVSALDGEVAEAEAAADEVLGAGHAGPDHVLQAPEPVALLRFGLGAAHTCEEQRDREYSDCVLHRTLL